MDRLYGSFRCNVCNRPSELGWVYVCTQDDKDPLAIAETPRGDPCDSLDNQIGELVALENRMKYGSSPPESAKSVDVEGSFIMPSAQLNAWVEKAIGQGHYTTEMIGILKAQKQHVIDVAKAAVEDFEESQRTSSASTQTDSTSQSVDANPHLPFAQIHEVRDPPAHDAASTVQLFAEPKLKMFPHCKFLACQVCRPTFKDRVWQRFEEIFATSLQNLVPILEATYRPLASLSVMRNIGLRSTPRGRPRLRHLDSKALYSFDSEGKVIFKTRPSRASADIAESSSVVDAVREFETKGFKGNVKRAIKGMLGARTRSRSGRKRRTRESTTSDEDAVGGDMGLWKEANDELLNEAARVPLPMMGDGIDGLAEGERAKETDVAGVAVTEEAADLGEADIILSV